MKHLFSLLLLSALGAAPLGGCNRVVEGSADVLRFTAIPDNNKTELELKFAPLAEHLGEVLGVPVEYVPTADYSASVEMFKNGDVDLAWFGGLTGVQARAAVDGARAIAQGRVDPKFKSYLIAHPSARVEASGSFPVEALRGKRFTFGSQQSTSGRLMPEYFIRAATGQAPDEFFGEVGFSGSHDKTAELVNAGSFEVGAINYRTYDLLLEEGRISANTCRIIWTTPEYADYNWTVHPGVEETFGTGTIDALQAALTGLTQPELLAAVQREDGLIGAENDDFEGIAAVARELGFLR
ncbi:MAG: phosphonate transport system substrate-binding protein [Chlamydiales bacterium]|jgi:phosphonate transport system substrate-binding protein